MARVLVTGIAGFIGSRIAHDLKSRGHEVFGVDNFNSYYSPELKRMRVSEILGGIQVVDLDLKELGKAKSVLRDFSPETVLHFAGQPGVRMNLQSWNVYAEENLLAFSNVLQSSIEYGVKNFLYASSSSVYGNLLGKTNESMLGLRPQSYYGATKLANEILASSTNSNLKIRGLRFFSVYGEYGRPDMAYFKLATSILTRRKFHKFGEGTARRDFTHISDVSAITIALINQLSQNPAGFCDVVNIGGGNPHTLNELIIELESQFNQKALVVVENTDILDSIETHADTSYLYSLIDTRHQIDFSTGIERFANWLKSVPRDSIDTWNVSN
jgi:UDP-glucuronate 4-epimerase